MLGPNGAGKTTTIRMMMDIFRPDGGKIQILGGKLAKLKKCRIGYLPESKARDRLAVWLKRLDLYEPRAKKVQELSKGMQQKAQPIATLVHEPDLIVADEPFSGLDPVNTRLVKDIIEEQRQVGKTVIVSTHQMNQVEALSNRIVLINRGRSVLYGEVSQIKRNFAGNAVRVQGQGGFANIPGVLSTRHVNGSYEMTLAAGTSSQNIFRCLAHLEGVCDPRDGAFRSWNVAALSPGSYVLH